MWQTSARPRFIAYSYGRLFSPGNRPGNCPAGYQSHKRARRLLWPFRFGSQHIHPQGALCLRNTFIARAAPSTSLYL
ncbi:hypothetical protein RJ55_02284 [Drechmeria coniospora]|nr:hypothetical protein RJ55_02284 [Drechmeria coniospora]